MDKTEKFWDKVSDKLDKRSRRPDQADIRTLEKTRKYLKGREVVLDYGCATGAMAFEIKDEVKMIHGIDISSRMIDTANRKAAERRIKNIHFAQATIFDDRVKRESFDVILAFNILHFLQDTGEVMTRINELLKPEGLLVSVTPCMGEKRSFKMLLFFSLVFLQTKFRMVPYMRFFRISELKDLIADGNFQIVETESLHSMAQQHFIAAKKS